MHSSFNKYILSFYYVSFMWHVCFIRYIKKIHLVVEINTNKRVIQISEKFQLILTLWIFLGILVKSQHLLLTTITSCYPPSQALLIIYHPSIKLFIYLIPNHKGFKGNGRKLDTVSIQVIEREETEWQGLQK